MWNIELIFMFWHVFVVNGNSRKRTRASVVRSFLFSFSFSNRFMSMLSYKENSTLVFNRCVAASLFWWFYPHLRQGNTASGHWFARRSFFPVWGRCNFLILLLSADLNAVLPQPSRVVTAHLAPHVASEWFYLSCLYFCICSPPTLIGKGRRQLSGLLVSPRPLHAGARWAGVVLYLLLFLFCSFLSGEVI